MIKKPIYTEFNLDAMSGNSRAIAVSHIDDVNTEVLEVCVRQGGSKIDLTGATVTARMVWHKEKTLVSDNVACTVDSGNVLIPFDNAAIQTHEGILKIEVNITRQRDVLTLQFPIYVKINDTILADAKVTPESQGTVPELLKRAADELARVQGYVDEGRVFEIIDSVLQGDPNIIPSLFVEKNEQDDYQLVYVDSEMEEKHVIFNFGNLGSGTKDYSKLENKPSINGIELNGNKTSDNLGLQSKIANYFTSENSSYIIYDFNHISQAYNSANSRMYRLSLGNIQNFPQDLADVFLNNSSIYIFHYINAQVGANYLIRKVAGYSVNSQYIEFAQFCTVTEGGNVVNASPWQELTGGGSQIVSGAVDANGHITFTDSDGNKFTTTGEGVIGADGFSPTATVQQTASGATVTITDKNGTTTANISNGADGQDYILTSQDKTDIANIVLGELPTTQGVLYGD